MAFQPAPDAVEVDINMILGDQLCQNTLYGLGNGGEPSVSDMQTLAAGIVIWWNLSYAPLVATAVSLRDVEVKGLWSQTAPYVLTSGGEAGDVISPALPNHNTWVVKFTTGNIGRSERGRNYIVGLTESQVTGNEISSTLAGSWVDAYERLTDVFVAAGMIWSVLSRRSNGAPRPTATTSPIRAVSYEDLFIDSQRRRLPGRGR